MSDLDPSVYPPSEPSVGEVVNDAWRTMVETLFKPFDIRVWLVLAVGAYLLQCGQGGGGFNAIGNIPGGGPGSHEFVEVRDWIQANRGTLGAIIAGSSLFLLVVSLLVTLANCVGEFALMDNLARRRAEIVEPIQERFPLALSLFYLKGTLAALGLVVTLALGIPIGLQVIDLLAEGGELEGALLGMVIAAAALTLLLGLPAWLLVKYVENIVVPVMYARGITLAPAFKAANELARGKAGAIALYFLLRVALTFVAIIPAALVGCLLGCCPVICIPFVGGYFVTLVLLPIPVYFMAMKLHFAEMLDPSRQIILPVDAVGSLYFDGEGNPLPPAPVPPGMTPPGSGGALAPVQATPPRHYQAPIADPNYAPPPDPFYKPGVLEPPPLPPPPGTDDDLPPGPPPLPPPPPPLPPPP
jgi:hypothetical protein